MNLFFLAVLLAPKMPSQLSSSPRWQAPGPRNQMLLLALYLAVLYIAPFTLDTRALIPVVLLTRVLLLYPYLGLSPRQISVESAKSPTEVAGRRYMDHELWMAYKSSFSTITIGYILLQLAHSFLNSPIAFPFSTYVIRAINNDSAVSALGYDLVVALSSVMAWYALRPRAKVHDE